MGGKKMMVMNSMLAICLAVGMAGCGGRNKIDGFFGEKLGGKIQSEKGRKSRAQTGVAVMDLTRYDIRKPLTPIPMFEGLGTDYYVLVGDDETVQCAGFMVSSNQAEDILKRYGEFLKVVDGKFAGPDVDSLTGENPRTKTFVWFGDGGLFAISKVHKKEDDGKDWITIHAYCMTENAFVMSNALALWNKSEEEIEKELADLPRALRSKIREATEETRKRKNDFL